MYVLIVFGLAAALPPCLACVMGCMGCCVLRGWRAHDVGYGWHAVPALLACARMSLFLFVWQCALPAGSAAAVFCVLPVVWDIQPLQPLAPVAWSPFLTLSPWCGCGGLACGGLGFGVCPGCRGGVV